MEEWTSPHICPRCQSKLVQPMHFPETSREGSTCLYRWCPDCYWSAPEPMTFEEMLAYEVEEEAFRIPIERELKRLEEERRREERTHMERMVDAFGVALDQDLITADDFGPRRWVLVSEKPIIGGREVSSNGTLR